MAQPPPHMNWQIAQNQFAKYVNDETDVIQGLFTFLERNILYVLKTKMPHSDELNDIAQNILLKIHQNRHKYDQNQSLKTWVMTITQRTLIDHWRKKRIQVEHNSMDDLMIDEPSPEAALQAKGQMLNLQKSLKKLHPMDLQIVELFTIEKKPIKEVSDKLGLTSQATKSRLHRARKLLKKLMQT